MALLTKERIPTARVTAEAAFENGYRRLTARQRAAVDAIEGPVMVLAGPGTGKTQVLALRVAKILRQTQMDPWNVLCLTFTESGVVAMRERLLSILGPAAYQVRLYTFHGFCNAVIQEFPEKFAEASHWEVLTELERLSVMREIIERRPGNSLLKPFGNPFLFLPDITQTIQQLKRENISPERVEEHLGRVEEFLKIVRPAAMLFFGLKPAQRSEAECQSIQRVLLEAGKRVGMNQSWQGFFKILFRRDLTESSARTKLKNDVKRWFESSWRQLPRQRELTQLYRAYQTEIHRRGRYDYDDMIVSVVARLQEDDELLAHYQEQFQYVLVDEYQDTNSAQNEFLQLLGSFMEKPNIFVVGDDKQSIFRFQGASVENLRFFYELYRKEITVISLKENFRSQQTVIDAASAVISHNQETIEAYIPAQKEKLIAVNGRAEEPLKVALYATEEEENAGVARQITALVARGVPPREIAVLYRYNREAASVREALELMGVSVRIETAENILDDVVLRQFIQLLRYITEPAGTPRSEALLAEIIQYRFWEFQPLAVVEAIHEAGSQRTSLFRILNASAVFAPFMTRLAQWRVAAVNHRVLRALDIILRESGYLKWILTRPGFGAALGRLSMFLSQVQQLNRVSKNMTVAEFVGQLDLAESFGLALFLDPAAYTADGRVRLMTAHKAKGLEFEHVFILHVSDKHWGNVRSRERLPLPHGLLKYDRVEERFSNEDERRLFYVAMTRAKQGLHLSYGRRNGQDREQVPAVFWHEVPPEKKELISDEPISIPAEERLRPRLIGQSEQELLAGEDESVREWLKHTLKQYVMSVTHLNNYLECPRVFYYRNLLRVPEAKTKHMAFGTAMHRTLADFFQKFRAEKKLPEQEQLLKQFARFLEREVLTDQEKQDGLALGQEILRAYYLRYQTEFSPEVLIEYDFGPHGVQFPAKPAGARGKAGNIRLTGKLDKIEIIDAEEKTVNVVDYKTGNPDNAMSELREGGAYRRQLAFYKLLTELSGRFPYTMASGEVDFLQASKRTGKHVKKKFTISNDETQKLRQTIQQVWQDIHYLRFLDPEVACGECQYCAALQIEKSKN